MNIDSIFASFNASEVPPATVQAVLPKGWYQVMIADCKNKTNNAGTGSYLELEMQVLDGEHKGRRIWDRLNLDNPNQTAVDIAKASLSAICHAVNVLTPASADELLHIPLEVLVHIQPPKGQYGESNVVKGYRGLDSSLPTPKPNTRAKVDLTVPDDDTLPF